MLERRAEAYARVEQEFQQERAAVLIMVVLVEPHSVDVRWLDGVGR